MTPLEQFDSIPDYASARTDDPGTSHDGAWLPTSMRKAEPLLTDEDEAEGTGA